MDKNRNHVTCLYIGSYGDYKIINLRSKSHLPASGGRSKGKTTCRRWRRRNKLRQQQACNKQNGEKFPDLKL